jgi:acyl-CoA synthetase (AMP-forming)/AMP-acid ligase II
VSIVRHVLRALAVRRGLQTVNSVVADQRGKLSHSIGADPAGTVAQVAWNPKLTLGELFEAAEASRPHSWLICASPSGAELRIGHHQFSEKARSVASGLAALGLGRGDVVAVQLPASVEAIVAHAACTLIGATLLPIVHIYGAHELQFVLRESGAVALITPARVKDEDMRARVGSLGDLPRLRHHVVVGADGGLTWDDLGAGTKFPRGRVGETGDVAVLLYTSGTTSSPKGVQHSHASMAAEFSLGIGAFVGPDDVMLCPWPPGHIAGYLMLGRFWAMGFNTVLMEQWDPALAARLVDTYKVVLTQGTPFHLAGMLDAAARDGRDLSSIKEYVAGATIVSPAMVARSTAAGVGTLKSFGLTECPTATRGTRDDPLEKRLTTDGKACPGVEIRIVDDFDKDVPQGEAGEVILRAPEMFLGYRRAELNMDVFLPGGWMRTGDIGVLDADGYLSITDRKKDIIIRGGENISSREVEENVADMPAVQEVAAVAMRDERLGERVCVFVALHPGHTLELADIDAFFRGRGIARQKTPEKLVVVTEFPRTASGKIRKNELRDTLNLGVLQ